MAALETLGKQKHLDRFGTGGRRLHVTTGGSSASACSGGPRSVPPWKVFARNVRPPSTSTAQMRRHLAEMHGSDMVGLAMARGRRRHIGQDDVRSSARSPASAFPAPRIQEIHLQKRTPGSDPFRGSRSPRPRIGIGRVRHLGGDLRPASGCRAQIYDALGAARILCFYVDLQELERRSCAVSLELRPLNIGVVDVALDPAARKTPSACPS